MASGGGNAQLGFGAFTKNPFGITNTTPLNSIGGFGSNSSSDFTRNPPLANTGGAAFSSSGYSTHAWFPTPMRPFDSSSSSNSTAGAPFSFSVSTSLSGQSTNSHATTSPFGTVPFSSLPGQTSNSPTMSPFGTTPFSSLPGQTSNSPTTSPFGSAPFPSVPGQTNNSYTTSPFGTAPFSSLPGQTSNSTTTSPFGTAPFSPLPTQTSNSPTTSPFGTAPFPFGQTSNSPTTSPFGTAPFSPLPTQTSNSPTTSPFGTAPFSFVQTSSSPTTSPFGTAPFSFRQTTSSPTTSPFGTAPFSFKQTSTTPTTSPFGTAPFSFRQTSSSPTTSPFGTAPFSPATSPFWTAPSMISTPTTSAFNSTKGIQEGTRQKAYEITPFQEGGENLKILSISAMPSYQNKSPEELRLEDYILTGKTGTNSTFKFPIINTSTSVFPSLIPNTSSSLTTTTFPKFNIVCTSSSTSPSFVPSTSSTSIFDKPITPFPPISQPVIMPIPKFDHLFPTTQTTTTVPNIGTGFTNITVPVTSIPETVARGGSILTFGPIPENNQQQQPASPCPVSLVTSPFGTEVRDTLPIKTVQYGISCLPVSENPKPAQKMPPVNVRQLSFGRRRPSIEKYKPNEDVKKVPFFEELLPGIYKKGAVLIPRENPRSWVVLPIEVQRLETNLSKVSVSDHSTNFCKTEEGTQSEDSSQVRERVPKTNLSKEIKHVDHDSLTNVIAMIPKHKSPEYYMEPSMEDLAANELKRPGFCCQVKDFVIGRRNCGNIKFLGETDVRNLDVESIVQFNNREVIVYKDEKGKPPVGLGLNKTAEITLLNIKCIDKSTGKQYIDGPKVDKYKKFLMKKAMEQGAEFVSFEPIKGEWRFKVEHF